MMMMFKHIYFNNGKRPQHLMQVQINIHLDFFVVAVVVYALIIGETRYVLVWTEQRE